LRSALWIGVGGEREKKFFLGERGDSTLIFGRVKKYFYHSDFSVKSRRRVCIKNALVEWSGQEVWLQKGDTFSLDR